MQTVIPVVMRPSAPKVMSGAAAELRCQVPFIRMTVMTTGFAMTASTSTLGRFGPVDPADPVGRADLADPVDPAVSARANGSLHSA